MMRRTLTQTWLAMAVLALVGCSQSETRTDTRAAETANPPSTTTASDVRVVSMDFGTEIGADKRVTNPSSTFRPNDTVYFVVATEGDAPGASITARWLDPNGAVVDERTEVLQAAGPVVTEFHVARPSGLPAGKYTVEVMVNGEVKERKDFTIGG
jgi:hypothetical protein